MILSALTESFFFFIEHISDALLIGSFALQSQNTMIESDQKFDSISMDTSSGI